VGVLDQRVEFVVRASREENLSSLCREYAISRPTGLSVAEAVLPPRQNSIRLRNDPYLTVKRQVKCSDRPFCDLHFSSGRHDFRCHEGKDAGGSSSANTLPLRVCRGRGSCR
jgi:hypothetical protein